MRSLRLATPLVLSVVLLSSPAWGSGAGDSKVNAATREVRTGAQKIGEGIEETAKGIGSTVVEGGKLTGEKLKESAKAAEPQAKSAGEKVRDGAVAFGHSVKNFFAKLFGN